MKKPSCQFFAVLLVATSLTTSRGAEAESPGNSTSGEKPLPEMNQAAREWLDSAGSEAFGKWLMQVLEQKADHPEWLAMFADILQGSQLGAKDGWFRKAVAQTRYDWKYLAAKYDKDESGTIERAEFPGSDADFKRLDRDGSGGITSADLAWPDHALARSPGSMLYRKADADGDGRVTRDEWLALFDKAKTEEGDFLSLDELKMFLPKPPESTPSTATNAPAKDDEPAKSTLIRGLFHQELGAMKPGPALEETAPDFTLKTVDGGQEYSLSKLVRSKPAVLIFGNFTCGPFRSQAGNIEKLFHRYEERANFLMVYVREAHPTDGWHSSSPETVEFDLEQPKTYAARVEVATKCQKKLGFEMPFVVDTIDDAVGGTYSGMPSRLYVIDRAGKVAYKSGRGPFGFKLGEMEQSLLWTLVENDDAAAMEAGTSDSSRVSVSAHSKTTTE